MGTLGVGIAGSGQKPGSVCRVRVTQNTPQVSATSLDAVRLQHGIVSTIAWLTLHAADSRDAQAVQNAQSLTASGI
ncbi:hypothetical protein GALL_539210 [mine drainage metagenome]|uniref:Uncharacterized protein n=1 Tax=mine drainage metagenome TaxID=410659 RepID=A0A1J5P9P0_9ZZZZ